MIQRAISADFLPLNILRTKKMHILSSSVLLAGILLVGGANILLAQDATSTAPPIEQLPASAYARAEAVVPQNIRKLIYGISVRPEWIGKTSRFWYEKRTRDGRAYRSEERRVGKECRSRWS